jgi:hypothetical protein
MNIQMSVSPTEEPLIAPINCGDAVVALCRLTGALARNDALGAAISAADKTQVAKVQGRLLAALQDGDSKACRRALDEARALMGRVHAAVSGADSPGEAALQALGWATAEGALQPVDVTTVYAAHSQPARQVFTTISFDHSFGAVGYRLREIRVVAGEDFAEDCLESLLPVFRRVRLAAGVHRFAIESRNHSGFVLSPEFTIEVPAVA